MDKERRKSQSFGLTPADLEGIARLNQQAQEMGLKKYPSSEWIWVEENYREQGIIPERFFMRNYSPKEGESPLTEYRLKLPITTPAELIESVKALDAFYAGTTDPVKYVRHGMEGMIDFFEKRQQGK